MATNPAACMAIVNADTTSLSAVGGIGRRGIAAWDLQPPPRPLTAAQRATVCTAINAGTVSNLADLLA